jgi:branched-chain amino acid transport system permease protein
MPIDLASVAAITLQGIFYGSILFLIAAGLQVVFGVQRILNLACGSLYALGAYTGITFIEYFTGAGYPAIYLILVLVAAGLSLSFLGPLIERGILRFIYGRDEAFQLLATFALVIIFEDVIRFIWGIYPIITKVSPLVYGELSVAGTTQPIYYLLIIIISLLTAIFIGFLIKVTRFGKMLRAVADDRSMSEALGVKISNIYLMSFTLGTVLGTVGGSLMAPVTAAVLGMGVEAIVLAFAVVVIGGLGSMLGAFIGSMFVGVLRAVSIVIYPELEVFVIYLIVIAVLLIKPSGLFGRIEE